MTSLTIGVLISAHPARIKSNLLQQAIESVLDQTRTPDAVAVAIDLYGEGAAKTKQRALEMLNTDFVAVLDSDDFLLPNHLDVLEKAVLETGADLVYSWFETDPPGNDPFPPEFFSDPWDPENPRHTTTTVMARTEMMKKVGYHATTDLDHPYSEDDWLMTTGLINLGAKIHHVAKRTWIWNVGTHPIGDANTSGLARNVK